MTSPTATPVEQFSPKSGRKFLVGLALVVAAILLLVAFFSHRGPYQIYRFRQERLRLEQENARLDEENARLARTIDRLQHDPELIQDLIRRELNFIKKNEIIIQLPPTLSAKPTLPPPAAAPPPAAGPAQNP